MASHQNPNLEILNLAVERLGPLIEEIVFLGGCAVGLLLTDPAAPLRPRSLSRSLPARRFDWSRRRTS